MSRDVKTQVHRHANRPHGFETTCWELLKDGRKGDAARREIALNYICNSYWQPLFQFIRSRGYPEEEAKDLTQEFFAKLMENDAFNKADPARGKFRSYLLLLVKHFLADEFRKRAAQKRGGDCDFIPIEDPDNFAAEIANPGHTEFDRIWALNILEQASRRLATEYPEGALEASILKKFEPGLECSISYADAAATLGLTQSAMKTLIHRYRKRHGELVRDEVRRTVAEPAMLEEEIRYLLLVLRT